MSMFLGISTLLSLFALLAIWLGYPAIMWCAAKVWDRRLAVVRTPDGGITTSASASVSVILATRDSAAAIAARVGNLLATGHPADRLEIIIALDATRAPLAEAEHRLLCALGNAVIVVEGDAPGGKAATLNAGVRAATGSVLVMADTQQRFDAHTIPELVASLTDERFGAVSGALTLGGSSKSPVHRYWEMEKALRYNESVVHSSIGVTGAVYAMRRSLWPVIPPGTLLDDVYVPMSIVLAGHRVGFCKTAHAFDVRTFDADAEGARKTRTLTGVMQLRELIPSLLTSRNPVRAQFVMHKLARLATPVFVAIFLLSAAVWTAFAALAFPRAVGAAVVLAVVLIALVAPLRRVALTTIRWGWSLQRATLQALRNSASGRWAVWTK